MEAPRPAARWGMLESLWRDERARRGSERSTTTECRAARSRALDFGPTARLSAHGRPASAPRTPTGAGVGGQRCVTPRQTCPRPNGFGRNLRSKTRWFTGFCNSHQVSHFATFFIDARAEISVAESRFDFIEEHASLVADHRFRGATRERSFVYVPWRRSRRGFVRAAEGADGVSRSGCPQPQGGVRGKSAPRPPPASVLTSSRVVLLGRFRQ